MCKNMEYIVPILGDGINPQYYCQYLEIRCQSRYVLRAVLTNSPNSIPPERVFSILNDTFDDDQDGALADYLEFALQRQYNMRGRGE